MGQTLLDLLSGDAALFDTVDTHAPGPSGSLPLTEEMLLHLPSGDLFGLSQNAGMGWDPARTADPEFLILSTQGGLAASDGRPIALGYHTGHWEVSRLVEAAARELKSAGVIPFSAYCTDPCDGRTQGTTGMFDSLAYRNDAAIVLGRLIRSLPRRRGVLGIATCDKGLPAMMMALAASRDLPSVIVPGGVTLMAEAGEDAGKIQTIGVRFAHGLLPLLSAAELGCRACATPGGGCQFLGTAATSQMVAEALGMALPHSALSPSGHAVWLEMARRSAQTLLKMDREGIRGRDVVTAASLRNAMVVHAACGGSSNVIMHLTAIAHAAGLERPSPRDWMRINGEVPRIVDALPNGPRNHTTIQLYLAGGVPEIMLQLRTMDLLDTSVRNVTGATLDEVLDWWEASPRRSKAQARLYQLDGIRFSDVILRADEVPRRGWPRTLSFLFGNLAPEGALVKSTAIDPSVLAVDGSYRRRGPARVFTTEIAAIDALRRGDIHAGDIMVLMCRGPRGAGMEETYQLTSALRHLPFGKNVALITDGRFSGVSTGACIGHVSPEALGGGPIGKVVDGDWIEIVIDPLSVEGSVNLLSDEAGQLSAAAGTRELARRSFRPDLEPDASLPDHTRLWAALQEVSGGPWGGSVYDVEEILRRLELGD